MNNITIDFMNNITNNNKIRYNLILITYFICQFNKTRDLIYILMPLK